MGLKQKLRDKLIEIEKVLLIITAVAYGLSFYATGAIPGASFFVTLGFFSFILLYVISGDADLYILFFPLLLCGLLAPFWRSMGFPGPEFLTIAYGIGLGGAGLMILIRAIADSFRFKSFELILFLLAIFIIVEAVLLFYVPIEVKEIIRFLPFCVLFGGIAVVFNENIWERFKYNQQNTIKYILLINLLGVANYTISLL